MAAEFARCRNGRSPAARACSYAWAKRLACMSIDGWPSSSAHARCEHTATTSSTPSACALAASSTSSAHWAGEHPLRFSPVSIFRCTRAVRPRPAAAPPIARRPPTEEADSSMSALIAGAKSSPEACSQHSTGAVIPAARSSSASPTDATPRQSAPEVRAARATVIAPWP
ncbi:uncharacterized protein SHXM_00001 [Streptomyces hygroscopicus]|nr:uncharacterized protein SHXM_00001 [Streptomyces hygroscopicus]